MKELVDKLVDHVTKYGMRSKCARRATTAVAVLTQYVPSEPTWPIETLFYENNGPVGGHVCTGVKGGCGCGHAEQRLVVKYLHEMLEQEVKKVEILSFLSPCSGCANLVSMARHRGAPIETVTYVEELEHDQMGKRILIENGIDVVKADR